jgi:hypothetical protein
MSIVTYRGVAYDTKDHAKREMSKYVAHEIYRGIKHDETVEVKK